jgi:hypothetical protein
MNKVRVATFINRAKAEPILIRLLQAGIPAEIHDGLRLARLWFVSKRSVDAGYVVNGPSSTDGTANAGSLDLGGNVGGNAVGSPNLSSHPQRWRSYRLVLSVESPLRC